MKSDTEGNSGLRPVSPVDGTALPRWDSGGGGDADADDSEGRLDCDDENDDNNDANGDDCNRHRDKLQKRMDILEHQRRGNSSHYDMDKKALQGFNV